jgi:hypothetical protein
VSKLDGLPQAGGDKKEHEAPRPGGVADACDNPVTRFEFDYVGLSALPGVFEGQDFRAVQVKVDGVVDIEVKLAFNGWGDLLGVRMEGKEGKQCDNRGFHGVVWDEVGNHLAFGMGWCFSNDSLHAWVSAEPLLVYQGTKAV